MYEGASALIMERGINLVSRIELAVSERADSPLGDSFNVQAAQADFQC